MLLIANCQCHLYSQLVWFHFLSVALCRYAGAGLFDSVQSTEPVQTVADYSSDMMCNEQSYQQRMLAAIGIVSLQLERLMGSAQDIEGIIDRSNAIHIVQTRPQV